MRLSPKSIAGWSRWGLSLVAVMLVVITVSSIVSHRSAERIQQRTQTYVAMLVHAVSLIETLEDATYVRAVTLSDSTAAELPKLEAELESSFERAKAGARQMHDHLPDEAIERLPAQLSQLHATTRHLRTAISERLAADGALQRTSSEIARISEELGNVTTYVAAISKDASASRLSSEIRFLATRIESLIRSLATLRSQSRAAGVFEELRLLVREMAAALSRLPSDANRKRLASLTLELASDLDSDKGVVRAVEEAIRTQSTVADDLADLQRRGSLVRARIGEIVSRTREELQQELDHARSAMVRGEWTTYLIACLSVSLILALLILSRRALLRPLETLRVRLVELADRSGQSPQGSDLSEIEALDAAADRARETVYELEAAMTRLRSTGMRLERANEDLQQFVHVASHDLKAPLRGIRSLAGMLEEDLGTDLPEASQRHLSLLTSRVQRMEALIHDLLQYARAGRNSDDAIRSRPVRAAIDDALALATVPETYSVEVRELPDLEVPATEFATIVRNLVDNAIRHNDRDTGRLVITADRTADSVEFSFFDDGPGVPPEFAEKIFEPFRRLSAQDEVEGSGLGLAIVRRLATSIAADVGLRERKGRGAEFWLRLPDQSAMPALESARLR